MFLTPSCLLDNLRNSLPVMKVFFTDIIHQLVILAEWSVDGHIEQLRTYAIKEELVRGYGEEFQELQKWLQLLIQV